jgi:DNA-binding transcriptional MerR regulator
MASLLDRTGRPAIRYACVVIKNGVSVSFMDEATITPAEVHEAADCLPSTLRAWHNRVGFLPREGGGWRKYTFADLIAVRLMVILTARGLKAHEAVAIIHKIEPRIKAAAHGAPSQIAVGKVGLSEEWTAEKVDPMANAMTALDFNDEVTIVLNLNLISLKLFDAVRRIRGLNTIAPERDEA